MVVMLLGPPYFGGPKQGLSLARCGCRVCAVRALSSSRLFGRCNAPGRVRGAQDLQVLGPQTLALDSLSVEVLWAQGLQVLSPCDKCTLTFMASGGVVVVGSP